MKSKIDSQLDELKKFEAEPVNVSMATADDLRIFEPIQPAKCC